MIELDTYQHCMQLSRSQRHVFVSTYEWYSKAVTLKL